MTDANDYSIDAGGFPLAATGFEAPGADTLLVVSSATGVPRYFYKNFAHYLYKRGWSVLTFDYRGIGDSTQGALRESNAQMRDWALIDTPSVLEWAASKWRARRLFVLGHSFGGQTLGLIERPELVTAAVGMSAQSGYWGAMPGNEKWRVRFAVTVMIPVLARIFGYLPWSLFASGEDLPKGVALEWARWCRRRNYLLDDSSMPLERYRRFTAPMLSYSIDDDKWGSRHAVDEMMRAYSNVTRRHIMPADYGLPRVGHMGFFRKGSEPIWDEVFEWLDAHD